MDLKLHNLVLLVGPSMVGKSHWAESAIDEIKRKYPNLNAQIVSSDSLRELLLGREYHKYDDRMLQVSKQAFQLLNARVEALMQWPVAAEIIIVDTTGLSGYFRKQMADLANKYRYLKTAVVFDYDNPEDYFEFATDTQLTQKHLAKFKKTRNDIKGFEEIVINAPGLPVEINIPDYDYYMSHFLPTDDYIVIGDVHGSWEALEKLPDDRFKIYVGDLVDKGTLDGVIRSIDIVYEQVLNDEAKFVIGNHDHWVVNHWYQTPGYTDEELAQSYFPASKLLPEDSAQKLVYLYESGRYFYRTPNMIITHAPTKQKNLGKLHTLREQKTIRYPRLRDYDTKYVWAEAILDFFGFLTEEEESNYPIHVWGHVALKRPFRNRCNVGIDTGAYLGNGLTYFDYNRNRYEIISTGDHHLVNDGLIENIIKVKPRFTLGDLDGRSKGRVFWMARNGVNFISGTMTPSRAHAGELESLYSAFSYYVENYGNVLIQPKYMGSRGQVYLFDNPEDSYVITRNGYLYRKNELLYSEYERLITRFKDEFDNGLTLRILDTEIMPWRLLGEGLIERDFLSYGEIIMAQLKLLNGSGIEKWDEYFNNLTVPVDGNDTPLSEDLKSEIIRKYKHHIWSTFEAHQNLAIPNETDIAEFMKQVVLYGSAGVPAIKPFTMLKDVYSDGSERLYNGYNTLELWKHVTDDSILVTDSYEEADAFFQKLTKEELMEGVVLKPPVQIVDGNIPYIKVRNKEYLRMVYGPEYQSPLKYDKLVDRKNIGNKVRASIQEWARGWLMLQVPYFEVNEENKQLIQLYINHITEDYGPVDPRL